MENKRLREVYPNEDVTAMTYPWASEAPPPAPTADPSPQPPPSPPAIVPPHLLAIRGKSVAKHNHSKDFFGFDIDVRKSDVQKGVRRNLFTQTACSFFAGYNMRVMYPESSTALAIQTNFINRLIVIAGEDIGLAHPALLKHTIPILYTMSSKKETRDPAMLLRVLRAYVEAPKSRLCSHWFNAYRKSNRELAISRGFGFLDKSQVTLATLDCFTWIEDLEEDELFKRINDSEPCKPHLDFFKTLQRIYKKASKFGQPNMIRYMLALAHYLNVPGPKGNFVREQMSVKFELESFQDASMLDPLQSHAQDFYLPPLDDSADVHTKSGRKNGRDAHLFRVVGAEVVNKHHLMIDDAMEDFYLNS